MSMQTVRDIMLPLSDYATVPADRSIRDALLALDDAHLGLWCGPTHVNLKRQTETLGAFSYDEILPWDHLVSPNSRRYLDAQYDDVFTQIQIPRPEAADAPGGQWSGVSQLRTRSVVLRERCHARLHPAPDWAQRVYHLNIIPSYSHYLC